MTGEEQDTFPMPEHGFTCFHCGETFKTPGSARDHFGFDPSADPACRIKVGAERGLVRELRKAEDEIQRLTFELHNEGADACKAYRAALMRFHSQIQDVEEAGYARGLTDGRALLQSKLDRATEALEKIEMTSQRLTNSSNPGLRHFAGRVASDARATLSFIKEQQ